MKKIISIVLLVCTLVLCLASCSSKEKFIGTWRGEWEYNGNLYVSIIDIYEDETYKEVTYKNYAYYSTETGKYEIEGNEIRLYETEKRWTAYKYIDGQLENGGHYFSLWSTD